MRFAFAQLAFEQICFQRRDALRERFARGIQLVLRLRELIAERFKLGLRVGKLRGKGFRFSF